MVTHIRGKVKRLGRKVDFIANMTTDNFYFWIKGFFDMKNPETLSAKEVQEIRMTLDAVTPPIQSEKPIYDNPIVGNVPFSDFSSLFKLPPGSLTGLDAVEALSRRCCGDNTGHTEFIPHSC